MTKKRVLLSWSGGKDSALALHRLIKNDSYEIGALVTTCDEQMRVSAHGVRIELIERQARAMRIPLKIVYLPNDPDNVVYLGRWNDVLQPFLHAGVDTIAFGDIFLEDLKQWRMDNFGKLGFNTIFPLWSESSSSLSREVLASGIRASICCIASDLLDERFLGREYDDDFVSGVPAGVDVCGENGEFHTFVRYAPMFDREIDISVGAISHSQSSHGSGASIMTCDLHL